MYDRKKKLFLQIFITEFFALQNNIESSRPPNLYPQECTSIGKHQMHSNIATMPPFQPELQLISHYPYCGYRLTSDPYQQGPNPKKYHWNQFCNWQKVIVLEIIVLVLLHHVPHNRCHRSTLAPGRHEPRTRHTCCSRRRCGTPPHSCGPCHSTLWRRSRRPPHIRTCTLPPRRIGSPRTIKIHMPLTS